ncbi:MAG: glycerol kinase GlpK [bacterium]
MKTPVIISLDQGTTSSRTIAFNSQGEALISHQKAFEQLFPDNGWVEHNPLAIWESQYSTLVNTLNELDQTHDLKAIGITNQRETVVIWDKASGKPIYNAIVWQDRRTAAYCDELKTQGHHPTIQQKTGLVIDAYFSATKIKWILDEVPGARDKAKAGELCFGTIDSWLIYKLTQGKVHVTDVTNASRTMICNIHTAQWDDELLALFDIPKELLPEIRSCSEFYGNAVIPEMNLEIPITGIAGDQQAALFGQICIQPGMLKNTYGTGCFLLMNTGAKPILSQNNLLTTIAWKIGNEISYALEGSVFVGGAAVQWLRDGLNLIEDAAEVEDLASTVETSEGVVVVPAFTGLGAPHWDPYARGAILGLTRGTTKAHIARATLEGITLQVYDIVKAMETDSQVNSTELRVDGGATANNLLMQIQADVFDFNVVRPANLESTALGAAYLAGLAVGVWSSVDELSSQWKIDTVFEPHNDAESRTLLINKWHKATAKSKGWIDS